MNIFGNAQKYTEKGFIRVTLRAQDGDHLETADEDLVRRTALSLTIQDSGRGMSSEYLQQKLYSPFAQEDTFASGLGLGLSIVLARPLYCFLNIAIMTDNSADGVS